MKFASYFIGIVYGLSTTFQIKNPRTVILPIAFAMIVITKYKVPNFVQVGTIYVENAWYFATFQFIIPSLLLCLAMISKAIKKPA